TSKAQATVAVIQPIFPGPGEFVSPALIGLDAIDETSELQTNVAQRLGDGTTADDLDDKISIGIKSTLDRENPTVLYTVSAKDSDKDRALLIAGLALEEAQVIFRDINRTSATDVRAAYQPEIDRAEEEANVARAKLSAFEEANNAYDLPSRVDQSMDLVSTLRTMSVAANAGTGGADVSGQDAAALSAARSELNRLTQLNGDYNGLSLELSLAAAAVSRLEEQVSNLEQAGNGFEEQLGEARLQLEDAQARSANAQTALSVFESQNDASGLPVAIQSQMVLVNQLVVSQLGADASAESIALALSTEEQEVQRLLALQAEYDPLTRGLTDAENRLTSLEQRALDTIVSRSLPAETEIKVLHPASIQSNLWWQILTYALGLAVAIFAGLTTIYLLAFFERVPPTVRELEQEFGRPVLAKVPRVR
ncbi:MAG TPA: hypothetical protein VIT93_03725, partial [Dehalococcoidia bacterium]